VINAQALQHFDSSALAVLLELRRAGARVGKTVVIEGLPDRLKDLATLYGIEGLLLRA
jgi:phospholipid transport system transporter-binding protein